MNQGFGSRGDDTGAESSPTPAVSGEDVLNDVTRAVSDAVGDRLLAAYALGSLAHGGFSPSVSDVDVAVILTDPGRPSDRESLLTVADTVRAGGSPLHARVSIFWGTPEFLRSGAGDGRFPPLDRLCLFEHGRLLSGTDIRRDLQPPTTTELVVAGAEFALNGLAEDVIASAPDPIMVLANGFRWTTKIVLFPARFLFTADTGREGTNEAAVRHYAEKRQGPDAELVDAAFAWRTTQPTHDHALALLNNGFIALYDYYLADHIERLRSLGEERLADRFSQWRSRLLAVA